MMPEKRKAQNWMPAINDFWGNEWMTKATSVPAVNIKETDKEFVVELAAPGLTKDDFKVFVNSDNNLVVTVENKKETEDKDKKGNYLRREFAYTQFTQTMILPDNIEKDKIEAKAEHGVLTIDIPKKTAPKEVPHKDIPVK